jgi:hypothetical protein
MSNLQWRIVEEDDATLVEEAQAGLAELRVLVEQYSSRLVISVEKFETIQEAMDGSSTPHKEERRGRLVNLESKLLRKNCEVLLEFYEMDTKLMDIACKTPREEIDWKTVYEKCQQACISSKAIKKKASSCSEDVKQFIKSEYMTCKGCQKLCRKQFCKNLGFKIEFVDNDGSQTHLDFVCNLCFPEFWRGLPQLRNNATSDFEVESVPSSPRPSPGSAAGSTSQAKRSKKKKKQKNLFHSPQAKQMEPYACGREVSSGSPVTVLEFPDFSIVEQNEDHEENKKKVTKLLKYPSNDRLVNTLMKNCSILALNDYLDEVEGDKYENLESTALEKSMLEEYRDECLAAAQSSGFSKKVKSAASKGYFIAAQMVSKMDAEAAEASQDTPFEGLSHVLQV